MTDSRSKNSSLKIAPLMCLIAGALLLWLWPTYLLTMMWGGVPNRTLDVIPFLSGIAAFPLFLVSLASLRWSCVLVSADLILGWVALTERLDVGISHPDFFQLVAALLMAISCLVIAQDGRYPEATRKHPTLINLF